jgi:hydrogenase maturation protease
MKNCVVVIGYGNPYCRDDGVGLYIINALRNEWGLAELQTEDEGLEELGQPLGTLMLHQLVPEVAPLVSNYEVVVFVDAHMGIIPDDVRMIRVQEEYRFHAVTHHMSPGLFLSMARQANGVSPSGYLVSVRGDDFQFGLGLSDACRRRADFAVQKILGLVQDWIKKDDARIICD